MVHLTQNNANIKSKSVYFVVFSVAKSVIGVVLRFSTSCENCTIDKMMSVVVGGWNIPLLLLLVVLSFISGSWGNLQSNGKKHTHALNFSTNDCFLTEPVYGHKFDFTALHSDFGHLATSDKGDIFDYNICGNLTRTCDGRMNVAACLKRGTKEYVLGTQHQLNYKDGKMYFSFSNGAECSSGGNYQLHVVLGCDYTLDKNQSRVTGYSDKACSFYITLETPLACLPEPDAVKANACSVKDPVTGFKYDLMPLSDVNYRTSDHNGSIFVINVCKPVLYGPAVMCPPDSSVCLVALSSKDYKKKYFNYGTVQANPVFENGNLLMRHPSPTPCNATHNFTSTIYFFCDKDAKAPELKLIGSSSCNYVFSFNTTLACNSVAPCTVITRHNEIYDMSSLQNKPFTLQMQEKTYTVGICDNAGPPCLGKDGSCVTVNGQPTSLGTTNSQLRFNQSGSPYLLYEDGAPCQKSAPASTTTFWSTKIEFVCANNGTKATSGVTTATAATAVGPKIIENSDCQLLIHYQTDLACREQIPCTAKAYVDDTADGTGEVLVDLSPLISTTENYVAKIDPSITKQELGSATKFFLNVCRPLVPQYGLGCPGGSAACMAKVDGSTPRDEKSLGFPLVSPVAGNRTSAELRYLKGGICPTDNDSQLSSGIEFFCDHRSGRGEPILKSITDCHYRFVWPTNVICPAHLCKFDAASCEIINDEINERYSLRSASYTDAGRIKLDKVSNQFSIDICSGEHEVWSDYAQGLVNLYFSAAGPCGDDGKVNVLMRLICSHETEGGVNFIDDPQCNLIYTQRTPDICEFLGLNLADVGTKTATTTTTTTTMKPSHPKDSDGDTHPDKRSGSIGGILAVILSVTFFVVCLGFLAFSPARRNLMRRCFSRSTRSVLYSRVHSNEEANLLLEPNGHFTDSDDDMLF